MPNEQNQPNDPHNHTPHERQDEVQQHGTGHEQQLASNIANRPDHGQDHVQHQNQEKRHSEQKTGPHGGTRGR